MRVISDDLASSADAPRLYRGVLSTLFRPLLPIKREPVDTKYYENDYLCC